MSVTIDELDGKFGLITQDDGQQFVNSIKVNNVWTKRLYCEGLIFANGFNLISGGGASGTIALDDGSVATPSMYFTNSPQTGIYRSGNNVAFASGGVQTLSVGSSIIASSTITSPPAQNLSINSSTSVIDFNGATLTNVGGITSNPNRYEVIATVPVTTINATPTTLYVIPTITNAGYTISSDIVCVDNTDNTSTGGLIVSAKGKNLGGTVTVSATMELNTAIDAGIAGIQVVHTASGTNIAVTVTGLVGHNLKWFGATTVTRLAF